MFKLIALAGVFVGILQGATITSGTVTFTGYGIDVDESMSDGFSLKQGTSFGDPFYFVSSCNLIPGIVDSCYVNFPNNFTAEYYFVGPVPLLQCVLVYKRADPDTSRSFNSYWNFNTPIPFTGNHDNHNQSRFLGIVLSLVRFQTLQAPGEVYTAHVRRFIKSWAMRRLP